MNPEIKAEWIAALRSGEYPQGRGTLRNQDGKYCCLGVLCELAAKAGIVARLDQNNFDSRYTKAAAPGVDTSMSVLPEAVAEWAGLNEGRTVPPGVAEVFSDRPTNPSVKFKGGYLALAELNDGCRRINSDEWERRPRTFKEIALYIERQL